MGNRFGVERCCCAVLPDRCTTPPYYCTGELATGFLLTISKHKPGSLFGIPLPILDGVYRLQGFPLVQGGNPTPTIPIFASQFQTGDGHVISKDLRTFLPGWTIRARPRFDCFNGRSVGEGRPLFGMRPSINFTVFERILVGLPRTFSFTASNIDDASEPAIDGDPCIGYSTVGEITTEFIHSDFDGPIFGSATVRIETIDFTA